MKKPALEDDDIVWDDEIDPSVLKHVSGSPENQAANDRSRAIIERLRGERRAMDPEGDAGTFGSAMKDTFINKPDEVLDNVGHVVNRTVNAASLGAYDAFMDPMSKLTGVDLVPSRASRDKFAADHPYLTAGSETVGGLAGAPQKLAGAMIAPAMESVARSSLPARMAAGAASGAGANAAVSGLRGLADGKDGDEVMSGMKRDAIIGGAFGAGTEAVAAGAGGINRLLNRDRKIGALNEAKNTISPTPDDLDSRGMYNQDPKLKVRSTSDLNEFAMGEQTRVNQSIDKARGDAGARFKKESSTAIAAEPEVDKSMVLRPLYRMAFENRGEHGQILDDDIARAINDIIPKFGINDSGTISSSDLMKVRRVIAANADPGAGQATAANRAWAKLSEELSDALPDGLKAANKNFNEALTPLERANGVLRSADERSGSADTAAQERTVARNLRRVGDENDAADFLRPQINEIRDATPQISDSLGRTEAAGAYKDTRYQAIPGGGHLADFIAYGKRNARAVGNDASTGARAIQRGAKAAQEIPTASIDLMPSDLMGNGPMEDALEERKRNRKAKAKR